MRVVVRVRQNAGDRDIRAADLARHVAVEIFRCDDFHRIGECGCAERADQHCREPMELVDHGTASVDVSAGTSASRTVMLYPIGRQALSATLYHIEAWPWYDRRRD